MLNEKSGINGRKVHFISLDTAFALPKQLNRRGKLVEYHESLLMFEL